MERHERLRAAFSRIGLSQVQTAERFGFKPSTFKANLNGHMPFSYAAAKEYARCFGVRAEWLYDGTEPMLPVRTSRKEPVTIPVLSWVAAGQLADSAAVDQSAHADFLTMSGLPPGEYFATDVKGDSMDRISPDGSRLVVNTSDKELIRGKPYLFSCSGETTYKLWESVPIARLEPYSTNPANKPIFLTDDDWSVIGRVYRSIVNLA